LSLPPRRFWRRWARVGCDPFAAPETWLVLARSLTGLSRRAQIIQRHVLYTEQPDGLAAELLRYRAVTPGSIAAAMRRWLDPDRMVEVETISS